MQISYTVTALDKNITLKNVLKNKLFISNILRYNLIKFNKVFVNNDITYLNKELKIGDIVKVILDSQSDINSSNNNFSTKFKSQKVDLSKLHILYEDEYLLIVNKEANIPSHPSCDNYTSTLSNIVHSYLKKQNINTIHLITRLDKNTTGICIFAKHKYIQELFIRKQNFIDLSKEYLALVYGTNILDHEIITKNITRDKNSIILRKTCSDNEGHFAKTEYYTISRNYEKNYSIIKVLLHTGRTHQIRVHMSSIFHPLLGDDLYKTNNCDDNIKNLITRQALHAYKISLNHPITAKKMQIIAPIPDDIKKLIKKSTNI